MADFSLNIGMLAVAFAFAGAWLLTGAYRRWAIRVGVIDRPNERSSHVIPTPRGGGAALVVSAGLTYLLLYLLGENSLMFEPVFVAALLAFIIALIGFFDDRFNLSVLLRFGSQILLAAMSVAVIYYFYPNLSWVIALLAMFFIIWMTNLFNFMDGIDGITAGHVITAGLSFAYVHYTLGEVAFQFHYLILAALGAGFLIWNWQPAKIFMGDVGSCFFGFIFAVLAV
ncbi:MAG: glycosyl transferase, partial [Bdellovibrionota bacterium]